MAAGLSQKGHAATAKWQQNGEAFWVRGGMLDRDHALARPVLSENSDKGISRAVRESREWKAGWRTRERCGFSTAQTHLRRAREFPRLSGNEAEEGATAGGNIPLKLAAKEQRGTCR